MDKNYVILGSTGSIGTQTLDVMEHLGLRPSVLAARSSVRKMEEQIRRYSPRLAVLEDESCAADLALRVRDTATRVLGGRAALCDAPLTCNGDVTTVAAMMGAAGLEPSYRAVVAGQTLALANKETLVTAGEIILKAAHASGSTILPVDSEHSAIWQCMAGTKNKREVRKIILTASGGPFFGKTRGELEKMTPHEALKHPNWSMGAKITVDSATMMNKGLELIEAMRLYDMPADAIEIVVHRESILHSAVEFADGAVLAQLATPDMRLPIQYALTYPRRAESQLAPLELAKIGKLTFYAPDENAFPCLALARRAADEGGALPAVMNGANETAVEAFLREEICFGDIYRTVLEAVEEALRQNLRAPETIDDAMECDAFGRRCAHQFAKQLS